MEGKCNLECTENMDYCCICCPKKETCTAQCEFFRHVRIHGRVQTL